VIEKNHRKILEVLHMIDNDIPGIDIDVLENEEMWAQRAIDYRGKGKYKVSYYNSGQMVVFKWFDTFAEATDFCVYHVKTNDVIEVKWYPNES
jgi:hypothetical protein